MLSFLLWPLEPAKAGEVWEQVGGNGLGDPDNIVIATMETWNNVIFAGIGNYTAGCRIYRSLDGNTWTKVNTDGFGHPKLSVIMDFADFGGQLYASSSDDGDPPYVPSQPGEIWRSADGITWTESGNPGLGNDDNTSFFQMETFNGQLYAGSRNLTTGAELYSTADGNIWNQVPIAGLDATNDTIWALKSFDGYLWLGTSNQTDAAEVWRFNGLIWEKYFDYHDFGPPIDDYKAVNNFFNLDTLYWEAINQAGAHIIKRVNEDLLIGTIGGMGDANNIWFSENVVTYGGSFYFGTRNEVTGGELWYSPDGWSFVQIANEIFNNVDNFAIYALTFKDYLYVGLSTVNGLKGAEIWRRYFTTNFNFGLKNKKLPQGQQNSSYRAQLESAGGTQPYTYSIVGGSLPDGLQLDPKTGQISGTPTKSGDFELVIQVQDAGKKQQKSQRRFILKIIAGASDTNTSQLSILPLTGAD